MAAVTSKAIAQSLIPSRALRARVRRFILDHGLVRRGDHVLAGISGGPDSTCLLVALAALQRSLGFTLCAAYFDHRLRGRRASQRELRYVRSLAEALAVPFQEGAGEVRAHARAHHRSLEEAARDSRYRFLAEAARDAGCHVVAVGHTRDDQAETLLLHLIRGSGVRGLAAMAPSAPWPLADADEAPKLVRPLLSLSHRETEASCREAGLAPIRDPSNRSKTQVRSRIRNELLPALRGINPRVDDALVRLASAAAADIDLLETLASAALEGTAQAASDLPPEALGAVRLRRQRLAAFPPALQRHAVRLAVTRLLGDARGLTDRHVRAILRASQGPTGAGLDLPGHLRADVHRSDLVLSIEAPPPPAALPPHEVALPTPGTASLGPWRFRAEILSRPPRTIAKESDPCLTFLDADACGERLWLRRRRRGDRFQPLGLTQPKKLQDFFVDAHVPRAERDAVPLLCNDRGIVWAATLRPAEWAKVSATTRRVLRVHAVRDESLT